ncbi:MAG: polysaccharide pyruvyl transferase family protein [Anaerolineaceae bacterium]|nr:polysaccharide pyruvyl transferase family protein [Anaerolineaceae bacterium]
MKAHTIVLAGNGSYSNRGCEAILRGTTTLLRSQLGECRFISNYFPTPGSHDEENEIDPLIIHRPFPLLKKYSLAWFEEQITRKVFQKPYDFIRVTRTFRHSLRDADAVLMLGGDNFSLDYPNSDVHFGLCRLAIEADVPVVIWGASIGPFDNNPPYEQWAVKELSKVNLICARETATLQYLAGNGITKNVILSADPAFFLQPSSLELPTNIEKALVDGCIGLNLSPLLNRFMKISGIHSNLSAWIKVASEIVSSLLSHLSLPILLVPHVTSEVGYISRDDYLFLYQVAKMLNEPERIFILNPNLNSSQTKWVISQVRVFAGARTHSTLAAISTCVPTICIGYSMKARGIAKDVYGHLDWLISGQDLVNDPDALQDRLDKLLSQEDEIRLQLRQINPVMLQRARTAAHKVANIIEDCGVDE